MPRIRTVIATVTLGLAVAACGGGVQGETGAPSLAPATSAASPAASPATSPATSPAAASPSASAAASPSASTGGAVSSPSVATPPADASPGATTEVPFAPAGNDELGGTATLTEYGATTQVVVEFNSFQLPATGAVAHVMTGTCETIEGQQSAGLLGVVDGRLEGNISIPANLILDLPHAVVVMESATATEPLVCFDLVRPS